MKSQEENSGRKRGVLGNPVEREYALLITFGVLFTIVIFVITSIRYMSFLDMNWDMGINLQMLWTNNHGYLLFETADYQTSGIQSFLLANSVYLAIPISYLYDIFPNPFTLLLIQSAVLSFSIVPIYAYAIKKVHDKKVALLIAISFVFGFAVLSGVFYDYHWEAFMPLEFFTFIHFYGKRRYGLSILILLLGSLTLEVFPFMIGSYLLYDLINRVFLHNGDSKVTTENKSLVFPIIFVILTGILAFLIGYITGAMVPFILGQSTGNAGAATHAITYLFNFGAKTTTIFNSLEYWFLLLASLGFVPLLKPRSLIVIIPWFYWSVIAYPIYTSQFGVQYGIIAMSLLLIPFIEGLTAVQRELKTESQARALTLYVGPISIMVMAIVFETTNIFVNHTHLILLTLTFAVLGVLTVALHQKGLFRRNRKFQTGLPPGITRITTYLLILIIGTGLIIGPLNPTNISPPSTGGYSMSYQVNPSYNDMKLISNQVGHNNTVLSTDNLFPFIANNPNAFSFYWYPTDYTDNPYFPYNQTNLPDFLLLDDSQMSTVPDSFIHLAFDTAVYGMKMEIVNLHYPGNIYLFEKGFKGNPEVFLTHSNSYPIEP